MFGIGFIFMFVGIIFSFSETTSVKFKCIAVGMPYAFLIADIVSWWLTKFVPTFAWLVIFAGMGMGVSFIFMWVTSLLEMWLYKPVYIDGIPYHYEQWKKRINEADDTSGSNMFISLTRITVGKGIQIAGMIQKQWLAVGLPFIQKLFNK